MAKQKADSKELIKRLHRLHEAEQKKIDEEPIEQVREWLRAHGEDVNAIKALAAKTKRRVSS